jgi:hypothetical protein
MSDDEGELRKQLLVIIKNCEASPASEAWDIAIELIMHLIAQHDAAIKGRLLEALPKEVEDVPEPDGYIPDDPALAADQVRNYTIRQCSAAIEEIFDGKE